MLIEPTPILPPSRDGRARLLAVVLVPAILLVAVVGVATLTGDVDAGLVEPSATTRPLADATFTAPSTGPATSEPEVDAALFPSRVLGLSTRSVSELVARRRGGSVDDALHAMRGYLTVVPGTEDCFIDDSTSATLPMTQAVGCRREVLLSQTDEPILAWVGSEVAWLGEGGAHLHIPVFQTVSLGSLETLVTDRPPMELDGGGDGVQLTPILPRPVVVLGRYDDPRVADPRTNAEHVNETFTLERVAWVDGALEEPSPIQLVAPPPGALAVEAVRARVSAALPSGTVVLSHVYLSLGQLARVDATAAGSVRSGLDALGDASDDDVAVWYVRVMVRDGNPVDTLAGDTIPRRLGWVVLTADGTVLDVSIDGFTPDR